MTVVDELAVYALAVDTAASIAAIAREHADQHPCPRCVRFAARTARRAAQLQALLTEVITAEIDADLATLHEQG